MSISKEITYLAWRSLQRIAPRTVFSVLRRKSHEPELELLPQLCDRGRVAVDVGANDGVYAWALLEHARQVVAFEPNPILRENLRRVLGKQVQLEAVALSDHAGTADMRIPRYRYGHATMEAENTLEGLEADDIRVVPVPTKRLDDYGLADVGFIKIDVEGFEQAVLRGAVETIRRCRPTLLVEIEERHKRGAVAAVARFLAELDYEGFYYHDRELHPLAGFSADVHQRRELVGQHGRYLNNFVFGHAGTLKAGPQPPRP